MKYIEIEPEENTFKTISVQTTYKCQMSCSNCYLGDMLNDETILDVDADRFSSFLSKLPYRTDIRFIGAEPTMNPDIFNLLKIVRKNGHRPSMLTNGLKLRREDYTEKLKNSGLNLIGLSMNGGLDNDVYQEFDNGRYANQKMIALENCFKYNILPHVNVIIDPTNIHIIKPLVQYIIDMANKYNRKISAVKYPVMLRLKSIGKIGNYRDTYTYSLKEMMDLFPIEYTNYVDGYEEKRSVIGKWGELLIKITDWTVDDDGVPDSGSQRRGILTENYKLAPFFEYYVRQHERLL
jgi:sulfatase maturation enzyme AslB (radical SAM superfamily)|tara:strand:- start:2377 stop:3255 length:879 start_codon:yes stop_codon:yes gene_type:complete